MNAIKEAHYNLGIAYLEAGQYNRAVPEFEAAIKLDPNFIGAHAALCRAYLEQNELENASTAVASALKLDANYQPALLLYGTIIEAYHDKGKAYLDDRQYTEAVAALQKAITLDADLDDNSQDSHPENIHLYVHLGAAYIGMKAYQEAVEALQYAIAQDADLVDAHYNLGYAYVEQGASDKAIPHLERAIAIAPHLKRAHYNLARAYRESGNLEAATNAITETLRLDPNYQRAHELTDRIKQEHYNRGITYLNDERYSEAVTAFQNAITLDSDLAVAHYNLGLAYLKMETYPRAVSSLEKTIVLDPNHTAAHHALALSYLGQQELGKARDAAREALKIDANYQPARSLLEAIDPSFTPPPSPSTPGVQDVTPSVPEHTADPQSAAKPTQETHHELGLAYLDAKMYTEAIAEFRKAIDLDPDFVEAHTSLGEIYFEMQQLDDAENAAKAALGIDADSQSARQLLEAIEQARPVRPEPEPAKQTPTPTDPSDMKQDLERGQVFLNSRQYDQAAAAFKRVIKANASSIEGHFGLGQAYLEIGAFDDAKTAVDTVLILNPNHRKARELIQVIKFASNIERNKKIRKKVLSYAVILGIIAVAIFGAVRLNLIPWSTSSAPPNLSIAASLEEPSGNGFLDAGETARLKFIIRNNGGTARNIQIRFEPSSIAGLRFKKPEPIPKVSANSDETIRIPITADKNIQGRNQALQIQLLGKISSFGKMEPLVTQDFSFKIVPTLQKPTSQRRK
ncbi:MAG: tetratricopeptide repeat protein [Candidatus Poribacteria bacterium]|nr:tetratricopeptide repeat protein [Candidatus Poribacteria bacterium]